MIQNSRLPARQAKLTRKLFYQIIYDLFIIAFVFYLIFIWIDRAFKDYISQYFNLNIVLVIVFVAGFFTVIHRAKRER